MTADQTAIIGRMPRVVTTFIRAEYMLDRFISEHFWSSYMIICGLVFTIIGLLSTLSVT